MNFELPKETFVGGMIPNLGRVFGDNQNRIETETEERSMFTLDIDFKGEKIRYRSPIYPVNATTLLFLLTYQKRTIAYISPTLPRKIHLDLFFLPEHVLRNEVE